MQIPQLRAPIVLVHGLFGFDQVRIGDWVVGEYFYGLPAALRQAGNRVILARLGMTEGIAQRAEQLKAVLEREAPSEPVHILAHSMGGLDARYLITHLGMAPRVLTLTTLGTPHRGSSFADWAQGRLVRLVKPFLDVLGVSQQAFHDLTRASCARFNEQTPDSPGVRYFSVAGTFEAQWHTPPWQFTAPVLTREEGPNDGIVSVASATWGESLEIWEGDHMNLVNWPQAWAPPAHRDRRPSYATLLGKLADCGF